MHCTTPEGIECSDSNTWNWKIVYLPLVRLYRNPAMWSFGQILVQSRHLHPENHEDVFCENVQLVSQYSWVQKDNQYRAKKGINLFLLFCFLWFNMGQLVSVKKAVNVFNQQTHYLYAGCVLVPFIPSEQLHNNNGNVQEELKPAGVCYSIEAICAWVWQVTLKRKKFSLLLLLYFLVITVLKHPSLYQSVSCFVSAFQRRRRFCLCLL